MTPSRFQVPPRAFGASHKVWVGLPAVSTVLSFCEAKKPMDRLSGDQNGNIAPSVPVRACGTSVSSCFTQMRILPELSRAVNASVRPSGETIAVLNPLIPESKNVFSGGGTENRKTVRSLGMRYK